MPRQEARSAIEKCPEGAQASKGAIRNGKSRVKMEAIQVSDLTDKQKRKEIILRLRMSDPIVYRCLDLPEHHAISYQDALEIAVCVLAAQKQIDQELIAKFYSEAGMKAPVAG